MKFLVVLSALLAVALASENKIAYAPTVALPAYYNAYNAYRPYSFGYSYGYNTAATPYYAPGALGYSYNTVGALPYAAAPLAYSAAPAVVAAAPAPYYQPAPLYAPSFYSGYEGSQHQYRAQDGFGNSAFGYAGGPSARQEVRRADGVVQGSFSYVDANNVVQSRSYVADALGFRVAGTDIPVDNAAPAVAVAAPAVVVKAADPVPVPVPVPAPVAYEGPAHVVVEGVDVPYKTPEVKAAEAEHLAAHAAALSRAKRSPDHHTAKKGHYKAAPRPSKPWGASKGRNQYPIASVSVPVKGHRRWRREADPEPSKTKVVVVKSYGGHGKGHGYHAPRPAYSHSKKTIYRSKKW